MNTFPFLNKLRRIIDNLTELIGKCVSWLLVLLVLLVCYDVAMRYFLQSGSVALQEMEWHLFSIIFLFSAGYTLKHDEHVRLDLIYKSRFMNDRRRAWVNLIGDIFFLIPFCLTIIITAWPFLQQSFLHTEGSPDPGGLPYRWIIKAAIPLGFFMLLIQSIADASKQFIYIMEEHE